MTKRSDYILAVVGDTVADFLFYDRKEDDSLQLGDIEDAITAGEITVEQIVDCFGEKLRMGLL